MTLWEIIWTWRDADNDHAAHTQIVNAHDPRLHAMTSREMVPATLREWAESIGAMNYGANLVGIRFATYSPVMVTDASATSAAASVIHDTTDPQMFEQSARGEIADRVPDDWPVRPLPAGVELLLTGAATCGTCGLSWDDDQTTSMTPAPAGRCPFEQFHDDGDWS